MGDSRQADGLHHQISAWLEAGGVVLAASDRAARALAAAFNRQQRNKGLSAWATPRILDWRSFVQEAWRERVQDGRLLLNSAQEEALWARIAVRPGSLATALEAPQHRIARLAMDAHELLCAYVQSCLQPAARRTWQQDAETFSNWLADFDSACGSQKLIAASRLPLELANLLAGDSSPRPPLLLVGFDRILPAQRSFFAAWGSWQEAEAALPTETPHFHAARDLKEELTACALWCREKLADDPGARLLVLTQNAAQREFRGQLERIFSQYAGTEAASTQPNFEFSLGVPLGQTALVRGAMLVLRWLSGRAIEESELDWLLATGQIAASPQESAALHAQMRTLRCRGQEQPEWTLPGFLQHPANRSLPAEWIRRIAAAATAMESATHRPQSPLEWAESLPAMLEAVGWPGHLPLSSADFQLLRSWRLAVETAGSLGYDGRRIPLRGFLDCLQRIQDETLFAPESHDAPILIAGPAEAAGLTADAIWFLGADEDNWPTAGPLHPFLPLEVQREAGMPHATAQLDAELAEAVTRRLLASAPEVHFSYARQKKEAEVRPSRLILRFAGKPTPLPEELLATPLDAAQTVPFLDESRIPFPLDSISGGSGILTAQSQCPFRAFATARLGAQSWEPAQAGLTASQRGQLLHAVLHSVWAGPPHGLHSLEDLERIADRTGYAAQHVEAVLAEKVNAELRSRMPQRYIELEAVRLSRLIGAWLDYEAGRAVFTVTGIEVDRSITLAGATIQLRLDRIDRLNDGTLLVIDYKTGNVSPKSWELPRPEDVQLPLYAGFALDPEREPLGGLVFAKIRPGQQEFAGRVAEAKLSLLPALSGGNALVKNPLTAEDLLDWREYIEQLARDFVAGKASVDPREAPKTCEHCGLESLCRIREALPATDEDYEEETNE